jgi:hypothetical protein
MSSPSGLRHRSSARQKTADRKKGAQKAQRRTNGDPPAKRLFVFTIDANTARIVKFETVDEGGARRELSREEKAALIHKDNEGRIEEVLEQTFEAGIACALGEDLSESQAEETDEAGDEAELRHLLLARLIEHSAVRHLMKSEALDRAIFGTLIQHAVATDRAVARRATTPKPQEHPTSAQTN